MKLKQIESILKACKAVIVLEGGECQWLGDGTAYYPVYGLPCLTRQSIFTMFDIPEDKRDKFYFSTQLIPDGYNFEDGDDIETVLERSTFCLYTAGRLLEPLKTSNGIAFINSKYLNPFTDSEFGIELYERTAANGQTYIAVKEGFMLRGIIMPMEIVTQDLVDDLRNIYELSKVALYNEKNKSASIKG